VFKKILIANRGEIAVRIIKTAQRLGIATVAVYSDADKGSLAVELADEAARVGPPPPRDSYLAGERIIEAARATGAEAIHPGYGFLSENAVFARAVEAAGLVWIGPDPRAVEAMGDKIASKQLAASVGVSVIPGGLEETSDPEAAVREARALGYPVMIKAAGGGGGRGLRIARSDEDVREGFRAARVEATTAFGDPRLLVEKLIESPRHIEIQVLGDKHGNVVSLGERECSIQRRNQKLIEESPSPFIDAKTRKAMSEQAVALAKAVGYDSAGTVECIAGPDRSFYFLEMNTRLQVEHPVTELVTGLDLVEEMLRSAAGEPLRIAQKDVKLKGWAIEARLCAEDPTRGFLPSAGRLKRFRLPEGVRVDSGFREGDQVSVHYDSLLAKIVAQGETRVEAVSRLQDALDGLELEGLAHNAGFLGEILSQPRFREGRLTTAYIAEQFPNGFAERGPTADELPIVLAAAAFMRAFESTRTGAAPRRDWAVAFDGAFEPVEIDFEPDGASICLSESASPQKLETHWRPGMRLFRGTLDGAPFTLHVARTGEGALLRRRGMSAAVAAGAPVALVFRARLPERRAAGTGGGVLSPMPGLVASVAVTRGQAVKAGETLLIIEAMKMENIVRAERDGVVTAIHVAAGETVAADALLVELE
jgi:propionyl-CoA carboxylase alpha chain